MEYYVKAGIDQEGFQVRYVSDIKGKYDYILYTRKISSAFQFCKWETQYFYLPMDCLHVYTNHS